MQLQIITRADAFAQGLKRFYTGRPCKFGHDSERFVSTGNCVECGAVRAKRFTSERALTMGKFVYPLSHPDDHVAAWAYCQALDIARGVKPTVKAPPPAAEFDVHKARAIAYKGHDVPPVQSHDLHPDVAEQLRQFGLLK